MSNIQNQNENENPVSLRSRQPVMTVKDTMASQANLQQRHALNSVSISNNQNQMSENSMSSYNPQKRMHNEDMITNEYAQNKRYASSSSIRMEEAQIQILSNLDGLDITEHEDYQPTVMSIQDKVGYLSNGTRYYIPANVLPSRQSAEVLGLREEEFDTLAFESLLAEGITPLGYISNENSKTPLESIDSYEHDLEAENEKKVLNYLPNQQDVTARMREVLIDWLHEVSQKFNLREETIILCVSIIDRTLCRRVVTRSMLQLLGAAAMLIATKYEELYPPDINDFVTIVDSSYSRDKLIIMEQLMLQDLEFKITFPYTIRFFDRALRVAHAYQWGPSFAYDKSSAHPGSIYMSSLPHLASTGSTSYNVASKCGYYLCHLSLQFYQFIYYKPSEIASAALAISLKIIGKQCWTAKLQSYVAVDLKALQNTITEFAKILPTMDNKYRYSNVRKRYYSLSANELNIPSCLTNFFLNEENVLEMLKEIESLRL